MIDKYGRARNYSGEDSWQFYKATRGILESTLLYDSVIGLKVVGVIGQTYIYDNINSTLNAYDKLIKMAQLELKRKSLPINMDINLKSEEKDMENPLEKDLLKSLNFLHGAFGASFIPKSLSKVPRTTSNKTIIGENIINTLLYNSLDKSRGESLLDINSKPFSRLLNHVANESNQAFSELGFVFEDAFIKAFQSMGQMNIIKGITKSGASRILPKLPIGMGRAEKDVTTTPDVIFELEKGKELKASIKLASDPDKIKYKTATSARGEYITKIARWSPLLKTYAVWGLGPKSQGTPLGRNKALLNRLFAATLASIAVGGYANDRALLVVTYSGTTASIRGLDKALEHIRDSSQLTFENLKALNENDYNENLQILAGSRTSSGESSLSMQGMKEEISNTEKFSNLHDINLSFLLVTKKNLFMKK